MVDPKTEVVAGPVGSVKEGYTGPVGGVAVPPNAVVYVGGYYTPLGPVVVLRLWNNAAESKIPVVVAVVAPVGAAAVSE